MSSNQLFKIEETEYKIFDVFKAIYKYKQNIAN